MTKKLRLICVLISILFIMPLNGYLFTKYDAWFPILLIITQIPLLFGIVYEWYKIDETPQREIETPRQRNNGVQL